MKRQDPPHMARRFLRWYCHPDLVQEIEGDLYELYVRRRKKMSAFKANTLYWFNVITFCQPWAWRKYKGQNSILFWMMLKNYFKVEFRKLKRGISFTFITVLGLGLAISSSIYLYEYTQFERSFDTFHENAERIHLLSVFNRTKVGTELGTAKIFGTVAEEIKNTYPEVEYACRFLNLNGIYGNILVRNGNQISVENNVYFTDSDIFSIFSFDLIAGNKATALTQPNSIVLTTSIAQKYFGNDVDLYQLVGKNIELKTDRLEYYQITGVIKDVPDNSHLKFDFLASLNSFQNGREFFYQWGDFYTYLLLNPNSDIQDVQMNMNSSEVLKRVTNNAPYAANLSLDLHALQDIHLRTKLSDMPSIAGNEDLISFLELVALIILIIAGFNHVNLSVAESIKRTSEVGIRKAAGANRRELSIQIVVQTFLINFFAFVLALSILWLFAPIINQLSGNLTFQLLWNNTSFWLQLLLLFIITTFLISIYPAFVISKYNPLEAIQQKASPKSGKALRSILITSQFVASFALIGMTVVTLLQMDFIQNKDLGIAIDNTIVVKAPGIKDSTYYQKYQVFKDKLEQYADIKSVITSSNIPGRESTWGGGLRLASENEPRGLHADYLGVDANFKDAFGLKMKVGRFFSEDSPSRNQGVVLNEAAVKALGYFNAEDLLGEKLIFRRDSLNIIGVIEDYHQLSLQRDFVPTVMVTWKTGSGNFYSIKSNPNKATSTLDYVNEVFQEVFTGNPFEYFFLDTYFQNQYEAAERFKNLVTLFAILALVIACLGIYGLSVHIIQNRLKEISIRKVLGANMSQVIQLLSSSFLKMVIIATLIGIPFFYFIAQTWLESFVERIALAWWIFFLPALSIIVSVLITVGYQTMKVAITNPVHALRNNQ